MTARTAIVAVVFIVVVAVAAVFLVSPKAIDPVSRPAAQSFDRKLVEKGAQLAAIGNCNSCHTKVGGPNFAGGLAIPSSFGTLYSTNISPDEETGIGRWSEEAFRRALRDGVDRSGNHLYPAFPYDHFTKLTDDDIKALYAFFMTREPVRAPDQQNDLKFPYNIRAAVGAWKLLYLRKGPFQPDASKDAGWNRGAYLADALAHCSSCHTPRNSLGAEQRSRMFAGGEIEGWTAYALNDNSPAPVNWTEDALKKYLNTGWHESHGVARGPMAEVIENLGAASPEDRAAIATYIASFAPKNASSSTSSGRNAGATPPAASGNASSASMAGGRIFAATCAPCHDSGRPMPYNGIDLALSTGPSGPTANNVANLVLWGLPAASGKRGPIMPGFEGLLSDQQIQELLAYVRERFGHGKPQWTGIDKTLADIRAARRPETVRPAPSQDPAQKLSSSR